MNNFTPFEKKIRTTYHLSPMDPAFSEGLERDLSIRKAELNQPTRKASSFGWAYAFVPLLLVVVLVMSIGPQKVLAQMQSWLGFVPGVGIVDTSSPFRVLAEPVTQTKDEVTITINEAFVSTDKVMINFNTSNLSDATRPANITDPECNQQAYLLLPDGSRLEGATAGFQPLPDGTRAEELGFRDGLPANINEASLVMPCLLGTAPGKAPENWQFVLTFKPAPEELIVMPVFDSGQPDEAVEDLLAPQQTLEGAEETDSASSLVIASSEVPSTQATEKTITPENRYEIKVLKVIQKPDAYILVYGVPRTPFDEHTPFGSADSDIGEITVTDATGKVVETRIPEEINDLMDEENRRWDENGELFVGVFAVEFSTQGLNYPLALSSDIQPMTRPEPEAFTELILNVGPTPKPGDRWEVNQTLNIGSVPLTITYIEVSGRGQYLFHTDRDPKWDRVNIQINGMDSDYSGEVSCGKDCLDAFVFFTSPLPSGNLTIRFSDPIIKLPGQPTSTTWSPDQTIEP
ncbi:MAG: hypothetical protein ABFD05_05475 [Anaerolineaceae bacterium]